MSQSISPPPYKKAAGIILYTYMYRQQEYNYFADTTKNKNQKKNNPKITKTPQKTKTRKTKNHQTINSSHRRPIRLSY